jgi:6-phosphofructo-2-kinase/fructose-2,6-biphosphatase 4
MGEINPYVYPNRRIEGVSELTRSALAHCSGVWDGLSTEEAKALYPDEWERFLSDPYAHRAPRAESYHDLSGTDRPTVFLQAYKRLIRINLSVRLEPIIFELERCQDDLLIIGHASVIRCLVSQIHGSAIGNKAH